ncbi:hypothetical protein V5799_005845 [Amblyomma americanum]|uniref:Lipocalin n=1 Tax=Amblyomma americanum TaxID=6943 RepID=A0AAQ4DY32_AMBAM
MLPKFFQIKFYDRNVIFAFQFFKTSHKIWLYATSEGPQRQCLSITKSSEDQSTRTYNFTQQYIDNTGTPTTSLTVKISQGESEKPPVMTVTMADGTTTAYTPEKFDVNEQCGIFSFTRAGKKQCEMYVWHDKIRLTTPQSCFKEFDIVCKGLEKHQLYSSSCPW